MGKAKYKKDSHIYVYFGDTLRKKLRKSIRKAGVYFAELKVVEDDVPTGVDEKVASFIAVSGDKLFSDYSPYGSYGVILKENDSHIFREDDFEDLRHASNQEIERICKACEYDVKEFKKAFKPFRIKDEDD